MFSNINKAISLLVVVLAGTLCVSIFLLSSDVEQESIYKSPGGKTTSEATDIIFAGHMYAHIDQYEDILNRISIYNPEFLVTGGDAIWSTSDENVNNLDSFVDGAKEISEEFIQVKGNHDVNYEGTKNQPSVSSATNENVTVINVDTNLLVDGDGGESCGFTEEQVNELSNEIDKAQGNNIVLVMHHALWANNTYLPEQKPNTLKSACAGSFWKDNIVPVISGKVKVVVSGDGGLKTTYTSNEKDGVTYILTGMPIHEKVRGGEAVGGPSLITLARIRFTEEGFTHGPINFQDESLLDQIPEGQIDTYNVKVDEGELEELYKTAPLYPLKTKWQLMIEPAEALSVIQAPLDAQVSINNGAKEPATFAIRGNVGNHWGDYKKSWDIEFLDKNKRQVKLVLPSDRGYMNQMYVQYISEQLGVPTSKIELKRLVINDIDFGIYLQYEDFDKAFIELNGYNSDAVPSKNYFRDHNDAYPINQRTSNTTGDNDDKSYQQMISRAELNTDNFTNYFDQDNYARWLAVQIITGDRHQNLADNFRYFIDRPTGRYIMVTWDASYGQIAGSSILPATEFQQIFYSNTENARLTQEYVAEFLEKYPEHRIKLSNMISKTTPIFSSDVAATIEPSNLANSQKNLLRIFDENKSALDKWIN